jgi:hypothetical protein
LLKNVKICPKVWKCQKFFVVLGAKPLKPLGGRGLRKKG